MCLHLLQTFRLYGLVHPADIPIIALIPSELESIHLSGNILDNSIFGEGHIANQPFAFLTFATNKAGFGWRRVMNFDLIFKWYLIVLDLIVVLRVLRFLEPWLQSRLLV